MRRDRRRWTGAGFISSLDAGMNQVTVKWFTFCTVGHCEIWSLSWLKCWNSWLKLDPDLSSSLSLGISQLLMRTHSRNWSPPPPALLQTQMVTQRNKLYSQKYDGTPDMTYEGLTSHYYYQYQISVWHNTTYGELYEYLQTNSLSPSPVHLSLSPVCHASRDSWHRDTRGLSHGMSHTLLRRTSSDKVMSDVRRTRYLFPEFMLSESYMLWEMTIFYFLSFSASVRIRKVFNFSHDKWSKCNLSKLSDLSKVFYIEKLQCWAY